MTGIPPQAIAAAAKAVDAKFSDLERKPTAWSNELALAALQAAAPFLAEDGRDAASPQGRATETNQARRDERERCAQLVDGIRQLLTSGPIGRESGERYIRADLIRAVLDEHDPEGTTDAA